MSSHAPPSPNGRAHVVEHGERTSSLERGGHASVVEPGGRTSVVEYGGRRAIVVGAVMLAALLQTLDSTITNVALPTLQGNLGGSTDETAWVLNGYTIAVVIVIPVIPWLQTVLGRKRYFMISIAGFTVMSFLCGISSSIGELIAFRIAQGIFGAGLLATGQAIMRDTFPESQISISQAIFALGAVVGPALGPPIGGWLVDNASWNWCFEINILPGIVSTILIALFLRDAEKATRRPLDILGLVLLVSGVGALQYLLSEGERYEWLADSTNLLCALVACAALAGLVGWELRGTRHPIVDIAIFKYRSLAAGFGLSLVLGAAIFGTNYILPQFVQYSLGYTATLSGLLVLVKAAPIAVLTIVVAQFVTKVDARILMAIGFGVTAIASFWFGLLTTPVSGFWTLGAPLALSGAALAFIFVPISVSVLGAVPAARGGSASAWTNLGMQLGGSVSIALLGTLVDRRIAFHQSVLASAVQVPGAHGGSLATVGIAQLVASQAAVLAYADTSYALAIFAAIAVPLVFIMRRPRSSGPIEFGG
jgi:DHA2 family multidrug resistance protein